MPGPLQSTVCTITRTVHNEKHLYERGAFPRATLPLTAQTSERRQSTTLSNPGQGEVLPSFLPTNEMEHARTGEERCGRGVVHRTATRLCLIGSDRERIGALVTHQNEHHGDEEIPSPLVGTRDREGQRDGRQT